MCRRPDIAQPFDGQSGPMRRPYRVQGIDLIQLLPQLGGMFAERGPSDDADARDGSISGSAMLRNGPALLPEPLADLGKLLSDRCQVHGVGSVLAVPAKLREDQPEPFPLAW